MVIFPMTLTDSEPGFQGHGIFEVEYRKKRRVLNKKITIAREETIPNIMEWYYVW